MAKTPEIWIEPAPGSASVELPEGLKRLPPGARPIGRPGDKAVALIGTTASELEGAVRAITDAVGKALEGAAPQSWTAEFGIAFKTAAGIPVLVSGEASANLKITLTWKKD